jgi:glycosyltransferase involved in cell wall biosynthesis
MLAQPNSEDFSAALARLISDPVLRKKLGEKAKVVSDELYTVEAFEKQIAILYTRVLQQIDQSRLMAARTVGNL